MEVEQAPQDPAAAQEHGVGEKVENENQSKPTDATTTSKKGAANAKSKKKGGLSSGIIVLIVILAVVVASLRAGLAFLVSKEKRGEPLFMDVKTNRMDKELA